MSGNLHQTNQRVKENTLIPSHFGTGVFLSECICVGRFWAHTDLVTNVTDFGEKVGDTSGSTQHGHKV